MVLKYSTGDPQANIALFTSPVPGSVFVADQQFEYVMTSLLPSLIVVMYMPSVYSLVFLLVKEKESGARSSMAIMGMTNTAYWMSWFVYYTLINTVITTLAWMVLLYNVINYSKIIYIWFFFWLYGESVFGQIVFLQSLFSASKYAGIVSTLVYFGSDFLNFAINDGTSRAAKVLASILPQVASGQTSAVFAEYEGTGVGIGWSTAGVVYQNYSFDTGLWMMCVSLVTFTALGLYLDAVLPFKYGKRESPIFCLLPRSYGCCRRERRRVQETGDDVLPSTNDAQDDQFEMENVGEANYEAPPLVCRRQEQYGDYLRIEGLQKTFPGGFQAVKGLNVKMYNG